SLPTQFLNPDGQYTGLAAFDPVTQTAPQPPKATQAPITISLPTGTVPGLNVKQHRTDFLGISLEMSVSDRVMGRNGTFLNPIFLNYIQNLHARAGNVAIRVGGNSQEQATWIPAWAPLEGPTINKTANPVQVPGFTSSPSPDDQRGPPLRHEQHHQFSSTSSGTLVFLSSTSKRSQTSSTRPLPSSVPSLLGFQMANEPDICESHGKKPAAYQIPEYMADWGRVRSTYADDRTDLIAPNVCCSWTIDELLTAGFLTHY
ncbi:hypothetical protein FRC01_009663, partial [Tulasnella sp. 417]